MTASRGNSLEFLTGPGVLRLFLASAVVVQHFSHLHLGLWAVYTFFILSGYWISVMYRKKYRYTKAPVLTFWCSRYMRLLPVYVVCTALGLVIMRFCSKSWFDYAMLRNPVWILRTLAIVSASSQRWVVIAPAWTLDIEMQFYLLAPLLLYLMVRARVNHALLVTVVAALIGVFVWTRGGLPRYLAFFLAGALIDRARWRPTRGMALASILGFVGTLVVVLLTPALRPMVIFPSVQPTEAAYRLSMLLAFATLPMAAFTLGQPSSELDHHAGDLAYSVYLFHPCVYMVANYLAGFPSHARQLLSHWAWVLVLPGSLAIYLLVDRPADVFRRRFVQSRMRKGPANERYPIADPVGT